MMLDPAQHYGVAQRCARSFYHRGTYRLQRITELEDVTSEAMIGLVHACRRFDAAKIDPEGFDICEWLGQRINWHLLDWYRTVYGRSPQLREKRARILLNQVPLDAPAGGEDHSTYEELLPDPTSTEGFDAIEDSDEWAQAMQCLTETEQIVVTGRLRGVSIWEIGQSLGYNTRSSCQSRVCQFLRGAELKLRHRLT